MLTRRRQAGLTLVELLVSVSAGLVVVGAGLSFLAATVVAANANLLRLRLHQDLQTVMEAVARDLARAGEWGLADEVAQASSAADLQLSGTEGSISANVVAAGGAPADAFGFADAAAALRGAVLVALQRDGATVRRHDIVISDIPGPDRLTLTLSAGERLVRTHVPAGSWTILNPFAGVHVNDAGTCVLLRYDLDGDGVQDDEEHFGFRLNAARTAIQATTTARDCTSGNWDAFTDPAFLRVEGFDVLPLRAASSTGSPIAPALHAFRIGISTRLVREHDAVRSLQHLVHSRNAALE